MLVVRRVDAEDRGYSGDAYRAVVIFEEGLAGAAAGGVDLLAIFVQAVQKANEGGGIAGVDVPAAIESTDDAGGCGFGWSNEEHGATCGFSIPLLREGVYI